MTAALEHVGLPGQTAGLTPPSSRSVQGLIAPHLSGAASFGEMLGALSPVAAAMPGGHTKADGKTVVSDAQAGSSFTSTAGTPPGPSWIAAESNRSLHAVGVDALAAKGQTALKSAEGVVIQAAPSVAKEALTSSAAVSPAVTEVVEPASVTTSVTTPVTAQDHESDAPPQTADTSTQVLLPAGPSALQPAFRELASTAAPASEASRSAEVEAVPKRETHPASSRKAPSEVSIPDAHTSLTALPATGGEAQLSSSLHLQADPQLSSSAALPTSPTSGSVHRRPGAASMSSQAAPVQGDSKSTAITPPLAADHTALATEADDQSVSQPAVVPTGADLIAAPLRRDHDEAAQPASSWVLPAGSLSPSVAAMAPAMVHPGVNQFATSAVTVAPGPIPAAPPSDSAHEPLNAWERQPQTLTATPQALEVGIANGSHGWLRVRAEMNDGGGVAASVTANSPASAQSFRAELPALASYLEGQQIGFSSLALNHTPSPAQFGADTAGSMAGHAGRQSQGDQPGHPASPSSAAEFSEVDESAFAGLGAAASGVPLPVGPMATGGWLNVIA